jgi:hypothetical protein
MISSRNSIDGSTTLQVERCMILDYINGKEVETENGRIFVSYFNVIDVNTIKKQLDTIFTEKTDNNEDVKTKSSNEVTQKQFDVNKEVFNFFLRRRQFEK